MTSARDRFVVHSIVECIRQYNFCFDTVQVEENLGEILDYYSIAVILTADQEVLLTEELYRLAEQYEFSEMVQLQRDSILS